MNKSIILGGGCFWCLEAVYQLVEGIISVESGYAGGHKENPTYREVCNETTGHAEVVKLTFDDSEINIEKILEIFFVIHDPTTKNRQGNDEGTQYRSVIFFETESEKEFFNLYIEKISQKFQNPIVTEITKFTNYYTAESYHQNYYNDNPNVPYCAYVVKSKVEKYLKHNQ